MSFIQTVIPPKISFPTTFLTGIFLRRGGRFKMSFIIAAAIIAILSLLYSHKLTRQLLANEKANMEVWAEAMRSLQAADENTDLNLVLKVINSNHTIPVVVLDSHNAILASRNLSPEPSGKDSLSLLRREAERIREQGHSMRMELGTDSRTDRPHEYIYVYYEESVMLRRLTAYPYIQLCIVAAFMLVALFALLVAKRAEQNRVWVGLSRETAHQLGTPISSLMAWSEVLRESYPDNPLLPEMEKDVRRLQLIAERFSKIGSAPELKETDLCELLRHVAEYIDRRSSQKVSISLSLQPPSWKAQANAPLFEWVVENLCKNAVDAMEGKSGSITITLRPSADNGAYIEVSDTGKGMPRKDFARVFKPGFTTKRRGWGLGLSLAKRIIEQYHHGRIYVKRSEVGKGTTFAIELKSRV